MPDVNDHVLAGLPDDVQQRLAEPPVTEKKLLELGASWPDLTAGQAQLTKALRLFVITWDPLERHSPRPPAFATANGTLAGLDELVIYVPHWSLIELATAAGITVAEMLSVIAGNVVGRTNAIALAVAAQHIATDPPMPSEPTPTPVSVTLGAGALGSIQEALSQQEFDASQEPRYGTASFALAVGHWQDIGLGAITDVAQHRFGRVDLDRSPVELAAAATPLHSCPACAGRRFGYPGDLMESQDSMCAPHHAEAGKVINRRTARANASNPDGWRAILDASVRLSQPHLPNGLASRLPPADTMVYETPEPEELLNRAKLVVEAARWFSGRRNDMAVALGEEPGPVVLFPDWLANLLLDLGRAGLTDEAIHVAEALGMVDPAQQADYFGQATLAFAEAGREDEVRARIQDGLTRWPDDRELRVLAGEALATIGDAGEADIHFQTAIDMADADDDPEGVALIVDRIADIELFRPRPPESRPTGPRRQPPRKPSRSRRKKKR